MVLILRVRAEETIFFIGLWYLFLRLLLGFFLLSLKIILSFMLHSYEVLQVTMICLLTYCHLIAHYSSTAETQVRNKASFSQIRIWTLIDTSLFKPYLLTVELTPPSEGLQVLTSVSYRRSDSLHHLQEPFIHMVLM